MFDRRKLTAAVMWSMYAGPPLGSRRQDILREPWFLGTLLGCIGGLLWLAFCIVSIWLYRRRKAVAGRKLKNMAAYSGNSRSFYTTTRTDWSFGSAEFGPVTPVLCPTRKPLC